MKHLEIPAKAKNPMTPGEAAVSFAALSKGEQDKPPDSWLCAMCRCFGHDGEGSREELIQIILDKAKTLPKPKSYGFFRR